MDLDQATNKPLEESIHAGTKAPDKKDLLHRIGIYLNSREGVVGAEVLRLLRDVDTHLREKTVATATPTVDATNIHKALQKMQSSLDRIEKGGQTATSRASYAAAAAQGRGGATATSSKGNVTTPSNEDLLKEERRAKEVTVRIEDPKEVAEMKEKSSKDILQAAQGAGVEVTGIRRLPSGDIRFHTRSQDARDTLQANTEWTKVVAASAKVQRQTYTVIVHGVRVANINTSHNNQNKAIANLRKANERLHQGLDIVRISWPMKAIRLKKTWSSLYIEVTTAEMANRLIREGLIEDYENKECKLFSKDCQITQCFNCHQYGHVGKTCRNETRCGHCASAHSSHACPLAGSTRSRRCIVCKKQGHEAWSPECEIRQMQKRRVQAAYESRPRFFPVIPRSNTLEVTEQQITSSHSTPGNATSSVDIVMTENNISDGPAMQLLQDISRTHIQPTVEANMTRNQENKSQKPTAISRKAIRRSRSASPTARDLSASPDRLARPKINDWKDTIMNPVNQLREKAYAKPARGRPKKIILADTEDLNTTSSYEETL